MSTSRRGFVVPDAREDASINRGITEDPDTLEPTDEEWQRSKPMSVIDPDFFQRLASGDFVVVIRQDDFADAPEVRRVSLARSRGGLWIVEANDVTARETFNDEAAARERARALMATPSASGCMSADDAGPLKPRRISAA